MKRYIYLIILVLPVLYLVNFTWNFFDTISAKIIKTNKGFAVIEAFTSEGCASCPPAYDVIGKIEKDAEEKRNKVFVLDFHVDHWDHMGWKDPYSESAFSDRQREYNKVLGPDYLYTPQIIVNGQQEFIGSSEQIAKKEISNALAVLTGVEMEVKVKKYKGEDEITVEYEVSELLEDAIINLALTENTIISEVLGGENAGKKLTHRNVVRKFKSYPLQHKKGVLKLPALEIYGENGYKVTGYVQNKNTMKIVTASSVALKTPEKIN